MEAMNHPGGFPFRVLDLTQTLDEASPHYPGDGPLRRSPLGDFSLPGGIFCANFRVDLPEHAGTHADAPRHFDPAGATLAEVPLPRCIGPGVLVDARERCSAAPAARIGAAELAAWEHRHGPPPAEPMVLISTGYARFWPDRGAYLGMDSSGGLHFPGLDGPAARKLALDWKARAVGIDSAGIDPGDAHDHAAHRELLPRGILVLENLAALDQLPPRGFFVAAFPAKWGGASGGPVRVAAFIPL